MKNKNYNNSDLARISIMLFNKNFESALSTYQEYLERYPDDYGAYPGYANLLIKLGRLVEAENVINDIIITSKTRESTLKKLNLIKIKLLCSTNRYQECLDLVRENLCLLEERRINTTEILVFLKKQLGLLSDVDYSGYSYQIEQVLSYSEKKALNHIKNNCNEKNPKMIINFYDEFPLEKVYYELRDMLPLEDKIFNDVIYNSYIFKYVNNGEINGLSVNYIKVITLQGSNDIITMYPYKNKEKISCIDLTEKQASDINKSKVKRLSQIEKFNKRYQKN